MERVFIKKYTGAKDKYETKYIRAESLAIGHSARQSKVVSSAFNTRRSLQSSGFESVNENVMSNIKSKKN